MNKEVEDDDLPINDREGNNFVTTSEERERIFKHFFSPSAFDDTKKVKTPKTISKSSYDRLNSCARTELKKSLDKQKEEENMKPYNAFDFRLTQPVKFKYPNAELKVSPIEDLYNRRRLNEYLEKAAKESNSKTKRWNTEYKEPRKIKKNIYEGPKSSPKKPREAKTYIERNETRSSQLRNQAIRQKISIMKEREYEKEAEYQFYLQKSHDINKKMTPYLKYLNSLEEIPEGGAEKKRKIKMKEDRERAIKPLQESIKIVKEAPSMALRECVFSEIQSEINKMLREEKEIKIRAEKETREKRGKYKAKCYKLWDPDHNH